MFILNKLPYEANALEPHMSEKTISFHYGKHHQAYVDNLNKLIAGTDFETMPLEDIVKKSYSQPEFSAIFNNAAQVYNHDIFWSSFKPANEAISSPSPELAEAVSQAFSSWENMLAELKSAAMSQFGSGWAWLVKDASAVKIIKTPNGENPLIHNLIPLLGIDVWEHSYYLDYQNRRADYLEALFANLINWQVVSERFNS